jgi:uncharacterized coiled-coil protein SlyX
MVMARYIIREGTVRGQGRYLAWDVECAPRIGSVWSDTMIKAVYEDRDKAEEIAKKNGGRVVSVTTKSERAVREERDAAVRRANQERTIEDLGEALASAIDERDAALAALAKLADVDRLLAIEEQAKRVARAERWHEWTRLAYLDAHLSARTRTEDLRDALIALNEASDALDAECHKLAEMVGEGES